MLIRNRKEDLTVGQEVRKFCVGRRHQGQPKDGWPAVIHSIGRKYVTLRELDWKEDDYRIAQTKFEIETGQEVTNYACDWFRTLPQVAAEVQRQEDIKSLKEHGIVLDWWLPDETLRKLANALQEASE